MEFEYVRIKAQIGVEDVIPSEGIKPCSCLC